MLLQLNIQNFAIVRSLDIDWHSGMTTITGETGAGKSIAIDALGLCLGDRAVTNVVRPNCKKAELAATFDISQNASAQQWLHNNDLDLDDECILRRVISSEGRSKAYINGSQVPLMHLKELGQKLINIHGQHDHQLITKANEQLKILDGYAEHPELIENVQYFQSQWKHLNDELNLLTESKLQREAQQQLLQYQVNELNEFALQEGEFETLEIDYKRHSNAQEILNETLQAVQVLSEDETFNVLSGLGKVSEQLIQLSEIDPELNDISNNLSECLIQLEDANNELKRYYERIELDPNTYNLIEERYSTAVQLAKKHQVAPEKLYEHHQSLVNELTTISSDEIRLTHIMSEIENTVVSYQEAAQKLSASRQKFALELSQAISQSMQELNMPEGEFAIEITQEESDKLSTKGIDKVQFLVSINPGQPLEAMHKVASGGELSRISLAMQVILADRVVTPSLIFDEVDVGISGPTAAMVGKKLQQLGEKTQVICVTHLPQVASKGHQQFFVTKLSDGEHTETKVTELSHDGRVQEIARLLAGDSITDNSLANAQELLAS